MAREARRLSKSGNYYVCLRGRELFVTDEDKQRFIEILEKNFATGIIHGYALTKTEIRLVVKEGEKGISMTMKPVTTSYARYFNRVHGKEGKLFADRFKSNPLETTEEIEECIKKLENTDENKTFKKGDKSLNKKTATKKIEKKADDTTAKEKVIPQVQRNRSLPSWLL